MLEWHRHKWSPPLPMFSQKVPVEALSCQRFPLHHPAGTTHTFFLSPFYIGHYLASIHFSSTKVPVCGCERCPAHCNYDASWSERSVVHLNVTSSIVFQCLKPSEWAAKGSEGYGQSRGTAPSLLSPLQRCSPRTTCPLGLHTYTHITRESWT